MKRINVNVELPGIDTSYRVTIGGGVLTSAGKDLRKQLGPSTRKIAICSNKTVFALYGETVLAGLAAEGFDTSVWLTKDGEQFKNWRSAQQLIDFLGNGSFERNDALVSLGGGVAGDLAGFAASIYKRGIPFIQIPTTLLAMVDASVGGKTGINTEFGKNSIGTFSQPNAVLIDTLTLRTLPERELTAGFCEMIKQGAVGGQRLLTPIAGFLDVCSPFDLASRLDSSSFVRTVCELIADHVEFKAKIVSGDERESSKVRGRNSRKILNFGHTFAHALEKVTSYKRFRHGEAVGYGILYAAELSKSLALLDKKSVKLLYDVVHRSGILPTLDDVDREEVIDAFRFDKKNASGSLQFVLLRGIGKPVLVSGSEIPHRVRLKALNDLLRQY